MELTRNEKFQLQYLLPIKGNIKTLEMAQQIIEKLHINDTDRGNEEVIELDFSGHEIDFLSEMIVILDQAQQLNLSCLSIVKKILNNRSNENG